jgi:uncharacterized protein YllA (UPF0747 family)
VKTRLTQYPGMNRFVLDWMAGDERFLPRAALWSDGLSARPAVPRPAELASALDGSNRAWGIFAEEAIARWADGGTRTIVAGQQVGFAGGPLYTLAKIASVVRMKRDLEKQGTPATALFWLATEDHDFDEVAMLCVPARLAKATGSQLDLHCIRATRSADSRAIVGPLPIPEPLIEQLLALFGIERPSWLREGITFRDSFAELIASLFGNEVILVDALLPALRRAGAPLFDAIESSHDAIQDALRRRGDELKQAGYNEQVTPNEKGEYTLLYELDAHGNRQPPTPDRQPERTSTSALTRPLLQDSVLRPDVFIGGPAEVAYYAQIAPLHELLGVPMPRVALRGHVLVVPQRAARTLERFGLQPAEVFASPDAILAEREPEGVARIQEIVDDGKRELLQRIEQIGKLALPADHALARSIQRSVGHLEYHFAKLGERAIKGMIRKDRERHAAIRALVATLYPDGHVQDRIVGWFAYWQAHGDLLVERMLEEVESDRAFFKLAVL